MKYDFDEMVERRGTKSVKWDIERASGCLPLWVADMDFKVAEPIRRALQRRLDHGVFAYTFPDDDYFNAAIRWFERRHQWTINRSDILYTTGVVPALSVVIRALSTPGDKVLLTTPVYNCFFSSIRNNGCEACQVPLLLRDGLYEFDYDAIEQAAADPQATLMVVCNPHNPGGRVWRRDELQRIHDICARHDVRVISDEIHCELVFRGHAYTPYGTVGTDDRLASVSLCSPSKSFNIAGLQNAIIVCRDADARQKIDRAININETCDQNPFGIEAFIAAYNEGEEWLEQMMDYVAANDACFRAFFAEHLPQYPVMPLEGTYLEWVDAKAAGLTSDQLVETLRTEAKVLLCSGSIYGDAGEGYLRFNLACTRATLTEALRRIAPVLQRLAAH